jgi:hypothetical protein
MLLSDTAAAEFAGFGSAARQMLHSAATTVSCLAS